MQRARIIFTGEFSSLTSLEEARDLLFVDEADDGSGVCGFAVIDGFQFAQVIEGSATEVLVIFTAIYQHWQIRSLRIVEHGPAQSRLFLRSQCVDVSSKGEELCLEGLSGNNALRMIWNLSAPGILIGAPPGVRRRQTPDPGGARVALAAVA